MRAFDISDIMLNFSYLFMLYGISISVKKSVKREIRDQRIVSSVEELIEEHEESCSEDTESLHNHKWINGTLEESSNSRISHLGI